MNRCKICNSIIWIGKLGACKNCMKKAENIIHIAETYGDLIRTGNARLNWFVDKIIQSRKNEIPN